MKRHQVNLPSRTVTVWHNGNHYHGNYTVDGQRLTVSYGTEAISERIDPFAESNVPLAAHLLTLLVSAEKKDF